MRLLLHLAVLAFGLGIAGTSPARAGGPITSGSTVSGSVAGPTFLESWTFSGTTGQRVVISAVTTSGAMNTNIVLKKPGGVIETSTSSDRLEWQLSATGTWTIEIQDSGLNDPGSYALGFMNITAGPFTSGSDLDGGAIVSSDVKTGTASGPADFDAYTFSGTNGQRVLIDAVETAGSGYNVQIFLYPPGGGTFATWSFGGNRLEWQLTATGTWTIVIEDVGNDTAGSFSMSFLNIQGGPLTNGSDTDGGALLSNQIKNGTFQQGVDFDAYTFTGAVNQHVILTAIATGAGTHNTQISLYPPNGASAEISGSGDRLDVQLLQAGTYTLVIEDAANDNPGTYTVSFVNVTAGPYTDGSDSNGGPIVSSDAKTGTSSGPADFDAYTFSGTNGQRVLIDAVETAGSGYNVQIFLYPPGGGTFATWSFGGNRLEWQLTATGTWTIVIEDVGNDTAGSFSMSFLNIQGGPLTNGSDTDGGALLSNQIKNGTFQQGVDFDAYTFTGAVNQHVILTAIATGAGTHNTQISLYPPNGASAEISGSGDRLDVQLLQAGTYTLVVEDAANDNPGTYTVSFVNVTAGPYTDGSDSNGGPIVSSDVKTGTSSGAADFDAYTFSGTNGQRVLIDAVETAGSGYNVQIFLYPPGGGSFVTWTVGGNRLEWQLTATGTWTIVIEDVGNDTAGSFSMSFLNIQGGPLTNGSDTDGGALLSNQIKNGTFQQGVDFDAYTFTGAVNQHVILTAIATGAGTHNTQISLYPPNGATAEISASNDRLDVQLLQAGTYTLVVEDAANDNPGTYTVSFVNSSVGPFTDGSDSNGGPIISNEIKTGTSSGPADLDAYTFSGTNGQRVLIGAVETAGAGYNAQIFLYPPGGGSFVTWTAGGNRLEWQLTATGTWTIVIEDVGNDTAGSYSMSFLNITGGPYTGGAETDGGAIVSGVPRLGSALSAADFDGYTFAAAGGDSVHISAVVTSGAMNSQISLFPPGGGAALTSTTADIVALPLTVTGTYTIVIEDNVNDQTGNYTVTMNRATTATGVGDLPIGDAALILPTTTTLLPASPSPFQSSTQLRFSLVAEEPVRLEVFDVTGARVRTLLDRRMVPGNHAIPWDGRDEGGARVASGMYYVRFSTDREVWHNKVVRVR